MVVIVSVDKKAQKFGVVSYGETKVMCSEAKRLGNRAYQAVMDYYSEDI